MVKKNTKKHESKSHAHKTEHKHVSHKGEHKHVSHKAEHKGVHHKHHPAKSKKLNKKDLITIIVLSAIILIIILVSIFVPSNNQGDLNDTNTTDANQYIPDTNQNVDSNQTDQMTSQEFQEKSLELQLKIFETIREKQLEVLDSHYQELGLDKDEMMQCIENNDYTSDNIDVNNATHVFKIQRDTMLASMVNITGTPGMYVNGYLISGAQDYNFVTDVIDMALEDPTVDFNYENKTYVSDVNASAKLNVIYNTDSDKLMGNYEDFTDFLKTSEQLTPLIKDFFSYLLDGNSVEVNYLNYSSPEAKEYIETLNVVSVPFWYLEGDISELKLRTDENFSQLFNEVFVESEANGYIFNPQIVSDLVNAANIQPLYQLIAYKELNDEEDYIIGDTNAPVTFYLFTDYDCPFCAKFEEESTDQLIENYVDTGEMNIIIKDYIVHEMSSLFPAVFSRCAQDQGKYLETHFLLYDLREELGQQAIVDPVMEMYSEEIEELNKVSQELMANQQMQMNMNNLGN